MSKDRTLVRLPVELYDWLKETSQRTSLPLSRLIREHLENAKSAEVKQRFMRHVGAIRGMPRNLSSRSGFSYR